jgi:hypothetical protein
LVPGVGWGAPQPVWLATKNTPRFRARGGRSAEPSRCLASALCWLESSIGPMPGYQRNGEAPGGLCASGATRAEWLAMLVCG